LHLLRTRCPYPRPVRLQRRHDPTRKGPSKGPIAKYKYRQVTLILSISPSTPTPLHQGAATSLHGSISLLTLTPSPSTFRTRHAATYLHLHTAMHRECPSLHGVLCSKIEHWRLKSGQKRPSNGASNRVGISSVEVRLKSIRACSCCLMIRVCSCCRHQSTTRSIYKCNVSVQRACVLEPTHAPALQICVLLDLL
jgi:hypothetical protein